MQKLRLVDGKVIASEEWLAFKYLTGNVHQYVDGSYTGSMAGLGPDPSSWPPYPVLDIQMHPNCKSLYNGRYITWDGQCWRLLVIRKGEKTKLH